MQIIARKSWSRRIGTIVKYFKREIVTAWISVHLWQEPQWNQRLSVSVSCIVFLFSYSLENNAAKFKNRPLTCGCKLTQRNLKTLNHSSLLTMVQQTTNDVLSTWARQIQWKCSDFRRIVQDHIASVRTGLTKFVWPFQKSQQSLFLPNF